jgi:hypothetical protein
MGAVPAKRMQLAYIISAYKLPDLLVRLVRRLESKNATFFIHVDKKTPQDVFKQMKDGLKDSDRVNFLERHKCYHGDFGHVQASLKGIGEIVSSGLDFDYAILLTGQDYPLEPNADIEAFFADNQGSSFMSYFTMPVKGGWGDYGGMERIERWHYRIMGQIRSLPMDMRSGRFQMVKRLVNLLLPTSRKLLPGLRPYGGSSYWNLSREAISYVYEYVNHNPDFVRFFKRTFISDEMFFQTILLNSHLKDRIINDSLRYIEWNRPGRKPAVLGTDDFSALRSSTKLFARKFDPGVDARVLDMIDKHLLLL